MSVIKPFKAVYYDLQKVKDLKKVVAPPYDVISKEEQTALNNLSPYNFTHIDFGKDKPKDDKHENKYKRAKATFQDWLEKGIMVQDDTPCIYFYKQEYVVVGEKYSRMGFISLMELLGEKESKVYPHENTHSAAIEDRLNLCKALNSHLSCIFVCYSDIQKKIEKIFSKNVAIHPPIFEVEDNDNVKHRVWRLDDKDLIKEISDSLDGAQFFIADGHHRYKVAQEYKKLQSAKKTGSVKNEPFNYTMTYFTNIDSKGLKIFPMHRIVKQLPANLDFLEEFFRVDKVKRKEDLLILLAQAGKNEHAFGLYTKDGIKLLRLKNKSLIDDYIKEGSKEYRSLDATILKCFIFDKIGVKSEDIAYTKDMKSVMDAVDNDEAKAGFIMNAVKISQLKSIALGGERMPPKTTYFYPKVLSGLTAYKMD